MRTTLLALVATTVCLPAQDAGQTDPLTAARPRLEKALQKAAGQTDTAFIAQWGPDKKPKGDDPFMRMMKGQNSGKVTGSWHQGLVHYAFDGDERDELLVAGRRTLARADGGDWQWRAGRFADGNDVSFAPDVELLLQHLATSKLAIVHRAVGSLDDRPVEFITVTLNKDQVTEIAWAGMLPPALTNGMFSGGVFRIAGLGGRGRTAANEPNAIVDLAIAIDPATSTVHQLQFRAYASQDGPRGGGVIVRAGGVFGGAAEEEEEEEEEEEFDESAPLVFENGLPRRSRKKKVVCDYTIRLSSHGQAPTPELDEQTRKRLKL